MSELSGKAHLLIEDEMPECLLTFCAHKAGYDVLIQRWHDQDFTEHLSVVRHPGNRLYEYLEQSFTLHTSQEGTRRRACTRVSHFYGLGPVRAEGCKRPVLGPA
jgi:hypothetical protein